MTWDPVRTIEAELLPGEVVRWTGAPSFPAVLLSQSFLILMGFFLSVFPAGNDWLGWLTGEDKTNGGMVGFVGLFFAIAGLALAAGGLLEVFGVWRTVYAVTDKRVLIVKTLLWRRVLAITAAGLNAVQWHEHNDGSGSITLRREVHDHGDGKSTTTVDFLGTRDVRGAVREIERLRGGAA